MQRFTKVVKDKRHYIKSAIDNVIFPNLKGDWKELAIETRDYIKYYVVDQIQGFGRYNKETYTSHFSVPLWALRRGDSTEYFEYYVAHELAHAFVNCIYRPQRVQAHGETYYKVFKAICPEHLQPYEYSYKPRNAKKYGIIRDISKEEKVEEWRLNEKENKK